VTFTGDDLEVLTVVVADAWRSASGGDWSGRAGGLEWSCTRTADHTIDAVLAPALFLASRRRDGYPAFAPITMGADATPEALVEGVETATRVLVAVVGAAEPGARAAIWRRPRPETRGPEDFVPRGGLELALHAHDVCAGLGVPFDPPRDLCDRLRRHTRSWPHWRSPGWTALALTGDPWIDLLRASGRRQAAS
jgi:hypothetical protein